MPRLLNINSYHYRRGGADAVYFDHAQLMGEHGYDNAFWAMQHPRNEPSEWSQHFVDEIEFGGNYSTLAKIGKAAKIIWSFEAQRKLTRLIAEFKPDIAHLHNIYHHLSPSILSTLQAHKVPVVLTAHDLKLACPSYSMYTEGAICERCRGGNYLNTIKYRCIKQSRSASTIIAAEAFTHKWLGSYRRHVDRIVVPSQFFGSKFVEWGWSPEHFSYIPNWVDAERFEPQYEPGNYFLYFGRLDATKGLETLIRAGAQAGVSLVIAGRGPIQPQAEALANSLGHDVQFAGFRSGDDLHQLIRGARAVVLPAEWYENAPISVLEAFALGKPVIGSRIGGIPEMITHASNGWLFPAFDTAALTATLREVAALPDAAVAAAGQKAREVVSTDFSRARYLRAMTELYEPLLARAGR